MGDLGRDLALFGGDDVFELSWEGVEPLAVRGAVLFAGFKDARLGLVARVLARSLAVSRAVFVVVVAACFVAVDVAAE